MRPKIPITLTLLFCGLFYWSNALAQEGKCDLLLKDGVRDYKGESADLFSYEKIKHWLSESTAKTIDEAKDDAQKVGIGVEVFKLDFGSHSADNEFQSWKRDFLTSDYYEFANNTTYRNYAQQTSTDLVNAFNKCVNGEYGTEVWIDASSDKDFAVFFLFRPPIDFPKSYVRITGFTVTNAICPRLRSYAHYNLGPVQNFQCSKVDPNLTSAVSLSTETGGPHVQPKFDSFRPPTNNGSVTIGGLISAQAKQYTPHPYNYTFSGTPTGPDAQRLSAPHPNWLEFTWTSTDTRNIDQADALESPAISPTNPGFDSECSFVSGDIKKETNLLISTATSTCKETGYTGKRRSGNGIQNAERDWLLQGHYNYNATVILLAKSTVNAPSQNIYESNSLKSSWRFQYTSPKDESLPWVYTFDIHITDKSGAEFHIFRNADGSQQLASGPFQAVFGDDHAVTIFRANLQNLDAAQPTAQVRSRRH